MKSPLFKVFSFVFVTAIFLGILVFAILIGVIPNRPTLHDLNGSWSRKPRVGGMGDIVFEMGERRLMDTYGRWRQIEQVKPWGWRGFQIDYFHNEPGRPINAISFYIAFDSRDQISIRQPEVFAEHVLSPPVVFVRKRTPG